MTIHSPSTLSPKPMFPASDCSHRRDSNQVPPTAYPLGLRPKLLFSWVDEESSALRVLRDLKGTVTNCTGAVYFSQGLCSYKKMPFKRDFDATNFCAKCTFKVQSKKFRFHSAPPRAFPPFPSPAAAAHLCSLFFFILSFFLVYTVCIHAHPPVITCEYPPPPVRAKIPPPPVRDLY